MNYFILNNKELLGLYLPWNLISFIHKTHEAKLLQRSRNLLVYKYNKTIYIYICFRNPTEIAKLIQLHKCALDNKKFSQLQPFSLFVPTYSTFSFIIMYT